MLDGHGHLPLMGSHQGQQTRYESFGIRSQNRIVSDGMNSPEMVKRLAASGSEPGERMPSEKLKGALAIEYAEIVRTVKDLKLN